MHADTGQLYTATQVAALPDEDRVRIVTVYGTPEQVHAVSRAVSAEYRRKRNARRRVQRASRRGNRGRR